MPFSMCILPSRSRRRGFATIAHHVILISLAAACCKDEEGLEENRKRRTRKTAKCAKKRGDGVIYKQTGTKQSEATPDDAASALRSLLARNASRSSSLLHVFRRRSTHTLPCIRKRIWCMPKIRDAYARKWAPCQGPAIHARWFPLFLYILVLLHSTKRSLRDETWCMCCIFDMF